MTRVEAVEFWNDALEGKNSKPLNTGEKSAHHIGYVEVRMFLDKLYGGLPTCKEEQLNRD
jgi:hypothetical protein